MKIVLPLVALLLVGLAVYSEAGFIGYAERKIFYSDNTQRSWANAVTHCSSQNMQLAEITSSVQQKLLMDNYHSTNFNGAHWINAQQHRLDGNIQWGITNTTVIDYSTGFTFTPFCLWYAAGASETQNGQWGMTLCTERYYRTLCQATIH